MKLLFIAVPFHVKANSYFVSSWVLEVEIPSSCTQLEYRYMVCKAVDVDNVTKGHAPFIISHWEAGVFPREKKLDGWLPMLPMT